MIPNKNNGHGKMGLPPGGVPILQQVVTKRCYICDNDMKVNPQLAKVEVLVCQACEIQKNLFLLNLYRQARLQGLAAKEQARQRAAEQDGTGETTNAA